MEMLSDQSESVKVIIQVHLENSEPKNVYWKWERSIVLAYVPVEEEVDRDGAKVPGGVSVQHPVDRRKVK